MWLYFAAPVVVIPIISAPRMTWASISCWQVVNSLHISLYILAVLATSCFRCMISWFTQYWYRRQRFFKLKFQIFPTEIASMLVIGWFEYPRLILLRRSSSLICTTLHCSSLLLWIWALGTNNCSFCESARLLGIGKSNSSPSRIRSSSILFASASTSISSSSGSNWIWTASSSMTGIISCRRGSCKSDSASSPSKTYHSLSHTSISLPCSVGFSWVSWNRWLSRINSSRADSLNILSPFIVASMLFWAPSILSRSIWTSL